jgi:catechol 2,3-dioxygenase-like lactoylglutathione lyase family enzyme
MIDHISIGVRDLDASAAFYDTVLGAIGLDRLVTRAGTVGYGKNTQNSGSITGQN